MSSTLIMVIESIRCSVRDSINSAIYSGVLENIEIPEINIEMPADQKNGDLSSNIALVSSKKFKMPSKKLADIIVSELKFVNTLVDRAEVAGPGFINFFLTQEFYTKVLEEVDNSGVKFGRSAIGAGKKVMIEFVSANPTGPMHMGNARIGAFGDCLASVLEAVGYDVWREFYINDAGNQVEKFGSSIDARYRQIWDKTGEVVFPEDGYQGDDIKELAQKFSDEYGDTFLNKDEKERQKAMVDFALPMNIKKMKDDMLKYKIEFDEWFSESKLHKSGEVKEVIDILKEKDCTYESDGALWYRATLFGAEKDEVLIKSNGAPTYFAVDIAYHRNKLQKRNFDLCIDILGADHHGHVSRLEGTMTALGIKKDKLKILLVQLVRLVKNGEVVRMSKRTGKAIQLSDLLDEVNSDAARFIFNMYESGVRMDFDLDLAVKKDAENPVYYVQYAYARICSIFNSCDEELTQNIKNKRVKFELLDSKEEKDLIFHMSTLASELIKAASSYDPTKITRYAISLGALFHKFYTTHKVMVDEPELMYARLCLCGHVRTVIKNVLNLLKISTPEKM